MHQVATAAHPGKSFAFCVERRDGLSCLHACHCFAFQGSSNDPRYGNRNDELSAACAVLGLLFEDFVDEIPGQQEDVVWLCLEERFRRTDRQMLAGHVFAVLVDVAVDDEIYQIGPDADGIDQRGAFGCGAVGGDRGALGT